MGTPSLRPSSLRLLLVETLTLISPLSRKTFSSPPPLIQKNSLRPRLSTAPAGGTQCAAYGTVGSPAPFAVKSSPISDAYCTTNLDAEEALMGFVTGKWKATEDKQVGALGLSLHHISWDPFHSVQMKKVVDVTSRTIYYKVWKYVIQKGDTVVDATCGNGHDTLALLKMIVDESCMGRVYGMDIQNLALESTSSLLENSVDKDEKKFVKLFLLCHSKMEDIVPKDIPVRLIAFNLGYLPGGDKGIITESQTTLMALQAASRILMSGGLISMVVYVGHPGGRDELETVQSFASSLPAETWVSCKLETLNRPTGPILVLLYKK